MKQTCKIMFAEFPGDFSARPPSWEWMRRTLVKCRPTGEVSATVREGATIEFYKCAHENISEVIFFRRTDTPIDMVRNHAVKLAKHYGCDYLLMIDNDMQPDQPGPRAQLFWETSFPWIFNRPDPALIFAPYLHGQESYNNVCVFLWETHNNRHYPFHERQYTREEAAARSGIERVAAGPTGLMLIDMRVFDKVVQPYFQYEWEDDGEICAKCGQHEPGPRTHKATTEDCYFTREVCLAFSENPNAGCYCNWDSWAEHLKVCAISRPEHVSIDQVGRAFREAVKLNQTTKEGVQMVERDSRLPPAKKRVIIEPTNGEQPNVEEHGVRLSDDGLKMSIFDPAKYRSCMEHNFAEFRDTRHETI